MTTDASGAPIVIASTANVKTFLTTPSSANLAAAVTDETGSGLLVFATSPTFSTSIGYNGAPEAATDILVLQQRANGMRFGAASSALDSSNSYGINMGTNFTPVGAASNLDGILVNCYYGVAAASTITQTSGIEIYQTYGGTGTITTAYGIQVRGGGAGSMVTNAYGGHFAVPAHGTNKQALYCADLSVGVAASGTPTAGTIKASATITTGVASGTTGAVLYNGTTSGTVTTTVAAAAGTYNWILPTTAGSSGNILTSGGGGSTAMTWTGTTGSGSVVLATSPTLATPVLGVASGTSLTLSGLTSKSILFAGTAGLISQNNSLFQWNDTDKSLGINAETDANTQVSISQSLPFGLGLSGTATTLDQQRGLSIGVILAPTLDSDSSTHVYVNARTNAASTKTITDATHFRSQPLLDNNGGTITNFRGFYFVPQSTVAGTVTNYYGGFFTTPGGGTNSQALYAADLAVGVAASGTPLAGSIKASATSNTITAPTLSITNSNATADANTVGQTINLSGAADMTNALFMRFMDSSGATNGSISAASATTVAFNTSSDKRLKNVIRKDFNALGTLKKIEFTEHEFKRAPGIYVIGAMAQDLQKVYPPAVSEGLQSEHDISDENWREITHPWSVDYSKLIGLIGKSVQELASKIYTPSDARLKTVIDEDYSGLALVKQMRSKKYEFKNKPGDYEHGFLAHELYAVFPEAVQKGDDEVIQDIHTGESRVLEWEEIKNPWSIDYSKLTGVLVKSVQELSAEIETLKTQSKFYKLTAIIANVLLAVYVYKNA